MGDESRPNNTEVEVNDEDIYIRRKFRSRHGAGCRAKDPPYDDDPHSNDDALNNKCRNGSFSKGVFRNSPELEMPAVNERPEDERGTHRSKGEGWAKTKTQAPFPEDVA